MWRLSDDPSSVFALQIDNWLSSQLNSQIGIKWYGLMYGLALLTIWWLARRDNAKRQVLPSDAIEDSLTIGFIGAIIGGRLGYVLWYGISFWQQDPWFPFKVWEGGMSFHGGLLGALLALIWVSRQYKLPLLQLTDFLAPLAPIGLLFGRIGNFINQELYGRVTEVAWAVCFPLVDELYRHPSQLYEALCEGLLLGTILFICRQHMKVRGQLTGAFLWGYGVLRMLCELFREPDWQIGTLRQTGATNKSAQYLQALAQLGCQRTTDQTAADIRPITHSQNNLITLFFINDNLTKRAL